MGGFHVRDPVADGLVDGVFQSLGTGLYADDLGLQQAHAVDVQRLAADILLAHVHDALQAQHGAGGGGGHAVLPRAGLGDDSLLAHVLGQERLPEGVVDLVGACVGQVLTLEVNPGTTQVAGEVLGEIKGSGAPDVGIQQPGQPALEILVRLHGAVHILQLGHRRHQGFGDELAAEIAKVPVLVGEYLPLSRCHPCTVHSIFLPIEGEGVGEGEIPLNYGSSPIGETSLL